ncbi:hypothetical protein [Streptomyces sp. NPDC005476]|uniref:hypothetical protein n=1 Tax=Streptomyces sp. NPDC005476 TaxID=3156882 RepID=UPI003451CADF
MATPRRPLSAFAAGTVVLPPLGLVSGGGGDDDGRAGAQAAGQNALFAFAVTRG